MGAIKVLVRTEGSSVAQLEKDLLPSLLLSHFSCVHSDHRVTCGHMVFSRQEYWSGLPYPQWGDLPNPEIQPMYHVSCIDRWVLYHWGHLGSPLKSLFCSVQLCSVTPSCPTLCDPWTATHQASLSITNSQSLLMSIQLVMPSNYLIFCRPLLLLPSVFPRIRSFSNESDPDVYIRQGCQERELRPEGKKHLVTLQQGNEHLKCAFEVQQNIQYIICSQHDWGVGRWLVSCEQRRKRVKKRLKCEKDKTAEGTN